MMNKFLLILAAVSVPFSCKASSRLDMSMDKGATASEVLVGATQIRDLSRFVCRSKVVSVAFFDADSTLRVSKSGAPAANSSKDVLVLPFVAEKIASLNNDGYLVAIISNQGGVGNTVNSPGVPPHILTAEEAAGGLLEIAKKIEKVAAFRGFRAQIDYLDMADAKDSFRKPESGMAQMLSDLLQENEREEYHARLGGRPFAVDTSCRGARIDWKSSFMIGDAGFRIANKLKGISADPLPELTPQIPWGVQSTVPYPRQADDFTNSDRLFAESLKISENNGPAQSIPLAFQEPADFFGWWKFETGNILPDRAKDEEKVLQNLTISAFLRKMEVDVARSLEGSDPKAARWIRDEVSTVRRVNAEE